LPQLLFRQHLTFFAHLASDLNPPT
jgi:hypothetical protein